VFVSSFMRAAAMRACDCEAVVQSAMTRPVWTDRREDEPMRCQTTARRIFFSQSGVVIIMARAGIALEGVPIWYLTCGSLYL
jgi:hypothetical protein